MKFISSQMTIGFLAACSSLVAASTDERLEEIERKLDHIYITTPNGTCGANTALARPFLNSCNECCGSGWFFGMSAIYWHAKVGGTDYAYTDQDPKADFPIKGRVKDMDFHWDWGLKVFAGYSFEHDGWDLLANYTYFDSSGDDKTFAGLNDVVIPLRGTATLTTQGDPNGAQGPFNYCSHAKSQYDFDYHGLELDLGRNFYVSKYLSFRPCLGLKASWIDLEQITRYYGGTVSENIDGDTVLGLEDNTVHVKDKSNFRGLGPKAGFGSEWYLGQGFSIFGETSVAMIFGLFDVQHRERYSIDVKNQAIKLEANRHGFTPNLQLQLGLSYKTYFNEDRNHLTMRLGYDSQYFWRSNQTIYNNDTINNVNSATRFARYSEDVSLMGFTFDVRVDF